MANYSFLDASGSVQTAASSTISGVQYPIVQIRDGTTVSVVGALTITGNPSISGAVTFPAGSITSVTNPAGSVTTVIATNPAGSITAVSATFASGSIASFTNPAGSVTAVTVTNIPQVQVLNTNLNIGGSVVSFQGTTPWADTIVGSVISVLQNPSIVGTYSEDATHTTADKGVFVLGVRNDAVASFMSADLEYGPLGIDSAGRTITKPFAPEQSRVEGYNSVVSTSVTTLVGAAGTGLKNYITDIVLVNTGALTTLVTFRSGGGTSILGYGIAPTGGGSNMLGFATPMRTLANETFDFQATTSTSVLFATVKGFKAP